MYCAGKITSSNQNQIQNQNLNLSSQNSIFNLRSSRSSLMTYQINQPKRKKKSDLSHFDPFLSSDENQNLLLLLFDDTKEFEAEETRVLREVGSRFSTCSKMISKDYS
jgi:hypothetical protein